MTNYDNCNCKLHYTAFTASTLLSPTGVVVISVVLSEAIRWRSVARATIIRVILAIIAATVVPSVGDTCVVDSIDHHPHDDQHDDVTHPGGTLAGLHGTPAGVSGNGGK